MLFRFVAAGHLTAALCVSAFVLIPLVSADQATTAATTDNSWDLSGGDPKRGQEVFASNGCGWCHEGSGRKQGRAPQLMNTKRTDEFLATRILNGLQGRMPAFGGSFDEDQIKDLIAFIHSLKPEATP